MREAPVPQSSSCSFSRKLKCRSSLNLLQYVYVSLVLGSPAEGKDPLPSALFLTQSRRLLAFTASLLSSWLAPSLCYWCLELFLRRCRTWHLPLLNLMKFLFASLSRSLCRVAQPSPLLTTPRGFVSSVNVVRVHSATLSRSSIRMLKST